MDDNVTVRVWVNIYTYLGIIEAMVRGMMIIMRDNIPIEGESIVAMLHFVCLLMTMF